MWRDVARKVVHSILALSFVLGTYYFSHAVLFTAVAFLFIFFASIRIAGIHTQLHTISQVSYGELFFPLGIGSALFFAEQVEVFQTAMYVLAFSDSVAALIGKRYGKHFFTILGEKRSFEGSMACFITTCCILFVCGLPLYAIFLYALLIMIVEILSLRGSDNLTLPLTIVFFYRFFV